MKASLRDCRSFCQERGQVAVLLALGALFFVALLAVVGDTTLVWARKRDLQNTADAAALAGARELISACNSTTMGLAVSKAQEWAGKNESNLKSFSVDPINCADRKVRVTVKKDSSSLFSGLGLGKREVTARAAAVVTNEPFPYILMVLGAEPKNEKGIMYAINNSHFDVKGPGGIYVASLGTGGNAPGAPCTNQKTNGAGLCVDATSSVRASRINVRATLGQGYECLGICEPTPTKITPGIAEQDPMADLGAPRLSLPAPCTAASGPYQNSAPANRTLNPGCYNATVRIADGQTWTMNPGVYLFRNDGIYISNGSTLRLNPGVFVLGVSGSTAIGVEYNATLTNTLTSSGGQVLLYFTCTGYSASVPEPCRGGKNDPVFGTGCENSKGNLDCKKDINSKGGYMNDKARMNLVGHPDYRNIVIWVDRGMDEESHFQLGGGTIDLTGIFYAPSVEIQHGGASHLILDGLAIAWSVDLRDWQRWDITYDPGILPSLPSGVGLVE